MARSNYDAATEKVDEDEGKLGMGLTNTQERALLTALADLGGGAIQDDTITHEGNRIVLPVGMDHKQAIKVIKRDDEAKNEETNFARRFRYRPWDVAVALQSVLKRLFGTAGLPTATWSFFGKERPQMIDVPIGARGKKLSTPYGQIAFPILDAILNVGAYNHSDLGTLGQIVVVAAKKHESEVLGLFNAVEVELQENSIYRGKAFDGQEMPEFIDLEAIDVHKAIYSEEVTEQLMANVWSLLEHTKLMRERGMPLKRAVLMEGPYGSGKTLAAFVTAVRAVENGWTFVYCRPAVDNLETVMATARLVQPAVVFYEDVDNIASTSEDDPLSRLLDLFDGFEAKGTEIMVIMTTNHIKRIHKAMARPGRLDAVIAIGAQDSSGVERMIKSTVPADGLEDDLDFDAIGEAMQGFMPAFVKEAIDRTSRYAIVRSDGHPQKLSTEDFVHAAKGLRPQLELQESLQEGEKPESLEQSLVRTVRESVQGTRVVDYDGDAMYTLQANGKE